MAIQDLEIFRKDFGNSELLYPALHAETFKTGKGTYYLKEPGVVMVAQSVPNLDGLKPFLEGFDPELKFVDYLQDPHKLDPAVQIVKLAGQMCYMSMGERRTYNKDAERYITNIVSSGHGSVLEHANFTFLFYGVSRDFTHELVRHRAGMAYSQESQRFVSGSVLRYVERTEFQQNENLHKEFEDRIDRNSKEYEDTTTVLTKMQDEGMTIVTAEYATDRRKKVRQAARAVLTNEAEAIIVVTGNARAWRHIFSMRANQHADIAIRKPTFKTFLAFREVAPALVADYSIKSLPDGTFAVESEYPKV